MPPSTALDRAAYVAPAPQPEPPRPQRLTARFGVGAGFVGGNGVAGTYFGQLDVWPLSFVGIGVEGEASSTAGLTMAEPTPTVSYRAVRFRATLRWTFPA